MKNTKIFPFGSPPLISTQYIQCTIGYNNISSIEKFIVMNEEVSSLLCKSTAEKLGVLKIMVNSVNIETIVEKYPSVASKKLGKLEGQMVKLHIDKSIPPVARKHDRVPVHLRGKVKDELERLIKNDIIGKVDNKHPTDWINPVIVVPKPNSDQIRLCIDMRRANEAIKRTRHVSPTVDDLITSVNGATVFSKLDLRMGYHQMLLDKSSRSITTFCTHLGLYRYKHKQCIRNFSVCYRKCMRRYIRGNQLQRRYYYLWNRSEVT